MTEEPEDIVAVVIGRSSSSCSYCRHSALPGYPVDAVEHRSGKNPCGKAWTHVTTDYTGRDMQLSSHAMMPHLPWIEYGKIPREPRNKKRDVVVSVAVTYIYWRHIMFPDVYQAFAANAVFTVGAAGAKAVVQHMTEDGVRDQYTFAKLVLEDPK